MSAVLALVNALDSSVLCNLAVGTTRWVAKDKSSDLKGIVTQFCDVPILAADLNFRCSRYSGLQIYETGLVKEGVGAGGASIASMAKLGGAVTKDLLLKEIEHNYALLMDLK
jgi:NaMN:DMB phosphoribosyltransferase